MNKNLLPYCFLLLIFFLINNISLSATTADSLLSEINTLSKNSNPLKSSQLHFELGNEYFNSSESFDKARDNFLKALEIAQAENLDNNIPEILFKIGKCHHRLNDYQLALQSFFELIEMDDRHYPATKKAKCFGQIAASYQALGDNDKAYQFQMKALTIHEKENDKPSICRDLYTLGTIFYYQERFNLALEKYLQSKEICDETKNDKAIYACLDALGSVYSKLKDFDKSSEYSRAALSMARKMKYKTGIAYSLGNLATDKSNRKEYAEAEDLHKESLSLKKSMNDSWGYIGGLINLADVYKDWGKPNKAIPLLNEALKLSEKIESKTRELEVYSCFNDLYRNMKQTDSAYVYLEKFVNLKERVLNEKILGEMNQTKELYEVEKKEQEIALLKTENKLIFKNQENQKLQKYIFIVLGISLLLLCWGILYKLKFQRSTNKLLEDKNEEIQVQNVELQHAQNELLKTNILLEENNLLLEDKNIEIETKNKLLETSNDDLQNFAYVASHDLKEPLRMISSYTTLIKKRYHDKLDDTGKEFMHYVTDGADRMKVMLDDLLSYSRVGNDQSSKTWVDMSDVMIIVNNNLTPRLRDHNAKLVIKAKEFPAIKANQTQMIQLLQNLISNGIKFRAERDPIVTVDCRYDNDKYIFSVKDNGIGISEENKKKVFEMFKRLHIRDEYEGTGIGLATCKKIVAKHNGDIWVESTLGEGSTFFFSLPCPIDTPQNLTKEKKQIPVNKTTQLINSQAER